MDDATGIGTDHWDCDARRGRPVPVPDWLVKEIVLHLVAGSDNAQRNKAVWTVLDCRPLVEHCVSTRRESYNHLGTHPSCLGPISKHFALEAMLLEVHRGMSDVLYSSAMPRHLVITAFCKRGEVLPIYLSYMHEHTDREEFGVGIS